MGMSGGFAFFIIYIILVIVVGVVILLCELSLGRRTGKRVIASYRELIKDLLGELAESGRLTEYVKRTIEEMSGKVLEHIARKHDRVREGVRSVMGGKVLEYEAKTILYGRRRRVNSVRTASPSASARVRPASALRAVAVDRKSVV